MTFSPVLLLENVELTHEHPWGDGHSYNLSSLWEEVVHFVVVKVHYHQFFCHPQTDDTQGGLCVSLEGDKATGLMMYSLFVCKYSSLSQYRAGGMGTQPGSALSLPELCLCSTVSWVEGRPSEGKAAGTEMTLVEHLHAPDTPLGS